MLIDWVTVVAQIINFLVLVGLLRYFLYGRVVRAMDEREERIASRLREAEQKKREAEREANAFRQKQQEAEETRTEQLAQVKDEVEAKRAELMKQVRNSVDQAQRTWHQSLEREKAAFLQNLQNHTSEHLCAIAHRILRDLAHADMEQEVIRVFVEQLKQAKPSEWDALRRAVDENDKALVVHSAFDIPSEAEKEIKEVLKEHLGDIDFQQEVNTDLLCGLELMAGGHVFGWNIKQYLDELEQEVAQALEEELQKKQNPPSEEEKVNEGTMEGQPERTSEEDDRERKKPVATHEDKGDEREKPGTTKAQNGMDAEEIKRN